MSEIREVIVDKDSGNNMENVDAFDYPHEEPTISHTKKFRTVLVILLEKELFKISLLVPVLCPLWEGQFFIELVVLRMLYLCS